MKKQAPMFNVDKEGKRRPNNMAHYVLCRRRLDLFGEAPKYCAKPITKPNDLNWCEGCKVNLPYWPE